jgi:RND family efflux transporter MFP subunit
MDAAAVAQAQASLKKSQYQFDHSQIRAPFPGRVVQRLINAGEYAAAGKDIVRLVQTDAIEVSTQLPIDSSRFLHEGQAATVIIQNKPVTAMVRAVVPVGDIASRTLEIRLTLPPNAAYVGDAAKVLVPSATPRNVLAVPRDALILREDNTYVFKVDKKNVATRVAVETGAEDGSLVEVKGQIGVGDRVIVRGGERLEQGQKVRPVASS